MPILFGKTGRLTFEEHFQQTVILFKNQKVAIQKAVGGRSFLLKNV